MKTLKKIFATLLALTLVMAMGMTALAADDTTSETTTLDSNGEQGAFTEKDKPVSQDKTLVLEKELKVYNPDQDKVNAPTITYNYSIAPATVADGTTVKDAADKHNSNSSVTVPVKAGIGTFSATVSWANDEVDADVEGAENIKLFSIDFSEVIFTGTGVYRYVIREALADDFSYVNTGVTETTGDHERFIDVYVKAADSFTNGATADEWVIYGFTCFDKNESITDADKTTNAVKTTGFVDGDNGTEDTDDDILADQYYTYNVEISKTITNDNYAKATHKFPFAVIFTNGAITKKIVLKTEKTESAVDFSRDNVSPNWSGVASLGDEDSILYVGIPMGTSVEVYETNDVTGVTYMVTTVKDGDAENQVVDNAVTWGSTPTTASAQAAQKPAYQSTKAVISTTAGKADDTSHTIAINNNLQVISPTGVVLRVAPYALILVAGMALLLVSRRRRVRDEE